MVDNIFALKFELYTKYTIVYIDDYEPVYLISNNMYEFTNIFPKMTGLKSLHIISYDPNIKFTFLRDLPPNLKYFYLSYDNNNIMSKYYHGITLKNLNILTYDNSALYQITSLKFKLYNDHTLIYINNNFPKYLNPNNINNFSNIFPKLINLKLLQIISYDPTIKYTFCKRSPPNLIYLHVSYIDGMSPNFITEGLKELIIDATDSSTHKFKYPKSLKRLDVWDANYYNHELEFNIKYIKKIILNNVCVK